MCQIGCFFSLIKIQTILTSILTHTILPQYQTNEHLNFIYSVATSLCEYTRMTLEPWKPQCKLGRGTKVLSIMCNKCKCLGMQWGGIFELSLAFYDRPNISFYLHANISDRFPSHFIFVGTKWTLINKDFGTFALILWASKYFRCPRWKNLVEIFVNSYFSD